MKKRRLLLICALLVSVFTLSGAANVITFTTAKTVTLKMEYTGDAPTLSGLTGMPVSGEEVTYALTAQTVTITGDVTYFDCSENQLTALDVSHNTALTELRCYRNQLTALDVSKNTELTELRCNNNQLPVLDISQNTALAELWCQDNQLTALDVSNNTALETLRCYSNKLTALDLPQNTALTWLYCSDNQLTSLDVSKNTKLTVLSCEYNKLAALDVSKNTALTKLDCNRNQLTALDISKNTALKELSCSNNQLTALDLSQNTALNELYCYYNQLTALDLSKNTELGTLKCYNNQLPALDVSQSTALTVLYCYDNQLTALDVSNNTALETLACSGNQLTALDLSQNSALRVLVCYGNQIKGGKMTRLVNSLPDRTDKKTGSFTVVQEPAPEGNRCPKTDVTIAKGKNWNTMKIHSGSLNTSDYEGAANVITFKTDKAVGETIVLAMEYTGDAPKLTGLTGTPVRGKEVTYPITAQEVTITGDVTQFKCSNNKLTALDCSQNTALTWLDCTFNQLTALDCSQNTALTWLYCSDNQLTALDLSENTALTKLWCEENELTTLDVSPNTALTELFCYGNQLTALDLSKNTALTRLGCYGNQIKGEKMTQFMNSLPDRTSTSAGTIDVVQEPAPEGNRCLKSDVAIAKGKNWEIRKYNADEYKYFAYEGEEPIPYAVTLTKEGEGTLTATGADDLKAVPEGTELTIEATPAAGYELTALTANDTDILATKKVVVTGATEVKATFTKKTYAVTLTKEGEGTLAATGATDLNAVPEGTELTIVATPADGYELKALTANDTDILATKKVVVTGATEVKATFTKKTAADVVNGSSVHLYPNPAGTYVNVKGAKADALVRLYDANGTLRYEARTDANGTLQIDLSAYAEGSYLLRVGDDAQCLLIQR